MKRAISFLILGMVILFATGCSKLQPSSYYRSKRLARYAVADTQGQQRVLQNGDRIRIDMHTPIGRDLLERVIDDRGIVTMPHLGTVLIAGLTSGQAERAMEKDYVDSSIYKEGAVDVSIIPPEGQFSVQMHVRSPGRYTFSRPVTVLQAVGIAGGPTEYAHEWKRILRKPGGTEYIINAKRVHEQKEDDRFVQDGDVIEVPPDPW